MCIAKSVNIKCSVFSLYQNESEGSMSYDGMYGSDDPDFDIIRKRGLDEIMPVSYSSVARKKVAANSPNTDSYRPRKKKHRVKRPKTKHDVSLKPSRRRKRNEERNRRSLSDSESRRKPKSMKKSLQRRPPKTSVSAIQIIIDNETLISFVLQRIKKRPVDSDSDVSTAGNCKEPKRPKLSIYSPVANVDRGPRRTAAKEAQHSVQANTPFYAKWVTDTFIHTTPYVPQMGDLVYFFPDGHATYRRIVDEVKVYVMEANMCPEVTLPSCLRDAVSRFIFMIKF